MTVEVRFMLSSGLAKAVLVPKGTLARIDAHVERLRTTFDLGKSSQREWSWCVRARIAATGKNAIADDALCQIAEEHERLVDHVWRVMTPREHKGETEEITPERAAEFWDALTMGIAVPTARWTADHYAKKMDHAYSVMRGEGCRGESFSTDESLSPKQAAAVIILFSQWLDEHDIRLDVPLDRDYLARSDDGGYDWCETCGAVDPDEAAACGVCRESIHVHKGDYIAYGRDDDYDPDGYGCMNVAPGLYRIAGGPDVQSNVRRFDKDELERVDDPPEGEDILQGEASPICRDCANAWIARVRATAK